MTKYYNNTNRVLGVGKMPVFGISPLNRAIAIRLAKAVFACNMCRMN